MEQFFIFMSEGFINFAQAASVVFMGMVSGSIPVLIILLTLINFVVKIVGGERVNRFAQLLSKSRILTYGILPSLAWFFFSSPGALAVGKFLPERAKPGFEDALGATVHPLTSIFPHVVPSELFIWLGVAQGLTELGLPIHDLAIRYLSAGILIGLLRGYVTEYIFVYLQKRKHGGVIPIDLQ